ncbi:Transmembrane protein 14C [Dissostichus eleginoides]|uniref:Transmembrane protein 14C n=1 Tax=Dissostichus eleginoides TaxID=100907 RepID=A0AAD9CP22_DISEL|nr:Transmembrane protein 14C [Dissostichus eleginoides]
MAVDWIGFGYALAIAFGGYMGYSRKGSVMSLMAGLVFGGFSAYGAFNISYDPKDIKVFADCWSPFGPDGNEIQEIRENSACWHHVRAKFADGVSAVTIPHDVTGGITGLTLSLSINGPALFE